MPMMMRGIHCIEREREEKELRSARAKKEKNNTNKQAERLSPP